MCVKQDGEKDFFKSKSVHGLLVVNYTNFNSDLYHVFADEIEMICCQPTNKKDC